MESSYTTTYVWFLSLSRRLSRFINAHACVWVSYRHFIEVESSYITTCVWFLSFSRRLSRFINDCACVWASCLFFSERNSIRQIYQILLICPLVICLGCFRLLTVMDSVAINIYMLIFAWLSIVHSFAHIHRSEADRLYSNSTLNWVRVKEFFKWRLYHFNCSNSLFCQQPPTSCSCLLTIPSNTLCWKQ